MATLLLCGCTSDPSVVKLTGNWEQEFVSKGPQPHGPLKGYLQLYLTEEKFKLHLATTEQTFELLGKWKRKGRRITLVPRVVDPLSFTDFQPANEDSPRKPNLMDKDVLTRTYGRGLVLDLDEKEHTLTSLLLDLGPMQGRHVFRQADRAGYSK